MKKPAFILAFLITVLCAGPAAAQSIIDVRSAVHRGRVIDETVEWRSSFDPGWWGPRQWTRLVFARPLPAGATIDGGGGASVLAIRNEAGRITGVEFVDSAKQSTDLVTRVEIDADWIDPPLVPDVPQRVELSGARLRPPDDSPLALRLTDIRHRAVDGETADDLEERWGDAEHGGRAVTLVPDRAYIDSGGLKPSLNTAEEAALGNVFLVGSLALLLVGLFGALKLFSRAAQTEEAEAFLRDFGDEEW